MPSDLRSWWERVTYPLSLSRCRGRSWPRHCFCLEQLERRILLNGESLATADLLHFNSVNTAQAADSLVNPAQVHFYQVHLNAGDQVSAGLNAQAAGSGLAGVLRVFNPAGRQIALDDQEGGDPQMTFQAPASGNYFVGVSSAPNNSYDPNVAGSGNTGATTGSYNLNLHVTQDASLQPDLTGASFRLGDATATWGEAVPVRFEVENRGGADAGAFTVQVLLSGSNIFTANSSVVLQTSSSPGLAAGQGFSPASVTVTLPDAATATAAGLPTSGPVSLGLRIVSDGSMATAGSVADNASHRGEDFERLTVLTPVPAGITTLSQADPNLNTRVGGTLLTSGQVDTYSFTVTSALGSGRLTARVAATGTLGPRLTLNGPNGQVLIQSDDGTIVQHLQPGTYSLAVSAESGTGGYRLISQFVPANPPLQAVPVGSSPVQAVAADVNGDGIPDLVTVNTDGNNVSVLLGNGDGTFALQTTYKVGASPSAVAVADLTGGGIPDLVVANTVNNTVSVLLGNGDGTFQDSPSYLAQHTFKVGVSPTSLAVADLTGDGIPDLVVANTVNNTVSVLLGNGDGIFQTQTTYKVGASPSAVAVADLTGDGIPDLVTANTNDKSVSVLLGKGDGTFALQTTYKVGASPSAVAVADLTGDGKPDLVVTNSGDNTVSVLLGNGDGTFQDSPSDLTAHTFLVGDTPEQVAVADVNGDGIPDLVTANNKGNSVSVLPGNGDGTFGPARSFAAGTFPTSVGIVDLNGDGKPDLVVANSDDNTVSVLLGDGDGVFQLQQAVASGYNPISIAVVPLTGDGKPDLVVANAQSNTLGVLLANGDGTFGPQQTFPVGHTPYSVVAADLNGDGKPDLVVANKNEGTVGVLLGDGDGTFQPQQTFAAGPYPRAVTVADLTGDGKLDLIVANSAAGPGPAIGLPPGDTVTVLLGNGDGTFQDNPSYLKQHTFQVGSSPNRVAAAKLAGDGFVDLVTANYRSNTVSVLRGNGDGTFLQQRTYTVGSAPYSVTLADVNGDGIPDIITANYRDDTVTVLLGNGDGTFQDSPTYLAQHTFKVGTSPNQVAVQDVNGDGIKDLVVENFRSNNVSVLLGNGDGTFRNQQTFAVGRFPTSLAVADLNGDGKPDIVTANAAGNTVSVLLGEGNGTFLPITSISGVGLRNTPYLTDLTGDGILDSVILDSSGNIRFRQGLPGPNNPFAPPVTVNVTVVNNQTNQAEELLARDLTVLHTGSGWAIATADTIPDPNVLATQHQFVYTVSLYTYDPLTGKFRRTDGKGRPTSAPIFTIPRLPTRIVAADLTGDGLDDIVVANSLDNSIQVAFQQPDGKFSSPITLSTGEAPSDISLTDVNGDGRRDIVVTNQASGDLSVFLNDPSHTFATSYRFRAGTGSFGLDTTAVTPTVSSLDESVSLAAGNFTSNGRNDLIVVNRGAHSFSVLPNDGNGGFLGPQAQLTTSTSNALQVNNQPGPIVAGYFNGPNRPLDLAILMEDQDQVWIYTGNGDGTFTHTSTVPAGISPSGLSLIRNPQTGFLDLLVGDTFGDILHLYGKGDGTFYTAGNRVSLDAKDLGNGQPDVLVANQQTGQVNIQAPVVGSSQFAPVVTLTNGSQTTLAPGAVQWAKLDKNSPFFDAVVVDSGGNNVLVYRGTGFNSAGQPTFAAPVRYAVGTDPVSVTIQPLTVGGPPDMLVADQGSNDITELFGSYDANGFWVGREGPRLNSGGLGPIAVTVRPVTGGNPDLVVTNGQSGTMTVLPGVGQGFFNDQNPRVVNIPGNPVIAQAPSFVGSSGIGVVPTADGRLFTFILNNLATPLATPPVQTFAPPASQGVAAVQALTNGDLVAALQNGEVVLLAPTAGTGEDQVVQELTPLTGTPTAPSALEILEEGSTAEVLVTSEGEDTLFVFSFGLEPTPVPLPVILLPLPEPTGPVAITTDLPEAGPLATIAGEQPAGAIVGGQPAALSGQSPLVLVVTLLAGNLPTGESPVLTQATAGNGLTTAATNRFTEALTRENQATGEEEEEEAALDVAAEDVDAPGGESGLSPPVSETLPQLELHEKTTPRKPSFPFSRSRPGRVVDQDMALVLLPELSTAWGPWEEGFGVGLGPVTPGQLLQESPALAGGTIPLPPCGWEDVGWVNILSANGVEKGPEPAGDRGPSRPPLLHPDPSGCSEGLPLSAAAQDVEPGEACLRPWHWESFLAALASGGLTSWLWSAPKADQRQRRPCLSDSGRPRFR